MLWWDLLLAPLAPYVILFAHEFAHAVASLLLGADVAHFKVGGGPSVRWRWGATRFTFGLWPFEGYVSGFEFPSPPRMIAICLAGPLASLGTAIAGPWLWLHGLPFFGASLAVWSLCGLSNCCALEPGTDFWQTWVALRDWRGLPPLVEIPHGSDGP
jgi:membrane-associated protease RseP (regulator of RpoE activity)